MEENNKKECCCHTERYKKTPRDEKELRMLHNRLNRIVGQLGGIGAMLDDNRYCGDILTQIAAVESALSSFGYVVLQRHMETCVVEQVQSGNVDAMDEALSLARKLR